eukprot:3922837-Heterocapsa_arctica.AAC.1
MLEGHPVLQQWCLLLRSGAAMEIRPRGSCGPGALARGSGGFKKPGLQRWGTHLALGRLSQHAQRAL